MRTYYTLWISLAKDGWPMNKLPLCFPKNTKLTVCKYFEINECICLLLCMIQYKFTNIKNELWFLLKGLG